MAATKRKKNQNLTQKVEEAEVIASTLEEENEQQDSNEEMISIACCLPFGLKFTDVPTGNGGSKTVIFPGVNKALKGKADGILALPGNAVCVTIPKKDWEAILAIHGKEIAFTGRNGAMPCVYPVGDIKGFKSAKSEIKEMKTGVEPVDPKTLGVKEAKVESLNAGAM